jgi:hypothetical protein
MKFKTVLAAAVLSLSSLSSQASVIYEWRPLNDETPLNVTIRMEFTEEAVNSGSFKWNLHGGNGLGPQSYPDSGLLSLYFNTKGNSAISFKPRLEPLYRIDWGWLDLDLTFEKGGFLTGTIYVNNTNSHFDMESQGRMFTIIDADSDDGMYGAGCPISWEPCAGATGHLRRSDIPEPGSIALLSLGLAISAGIRRRAKPYDAAAQTQ